MKKIMQVSFRINDFTYNSSKKKGIERSKKGGRLLFKVFFSLSRRRKMKNYVCICPLNFFFPFFKSLSFKPLKDVMNFKKHFLENLRLNMCVLSYVLW